MKHEKTLVISYKEKDYYLYHWLLINCIKNLLANDDIISNSVFSYENHIDVSNKQSFNWFILYLLI